MGGFPAAGPLFGAAYNPESIMPTSTMIDLIQGGNLDAAVLGCAEVGAWENRVWLFPFMTMLDSQGSRIFTGPVFSVTDLITTNQGE